MRIRDEDYEAGCFDRITRLEGLKLDEAEYETKTEY